MAITMLRLTSAVHFVDGAVRPFRTAWRWLDGHPRRYRDVAPVLVCPVCGGRTRLTPELGSLLRSQSARCRQCGDGVFTRVQFDGHRAKDTSA